jgi:hypothetical protein
MVRNSTSTCQISIKMDKFIYFTRLPPEIRNHIYELLLVNEHPIPITSPRKKHAVKKELPKTNFGRLLRVNKQFNTEAKTVFYSLNSFVVGNGPFGLTTQENLHALRAFITRVPAICVRRITRVHFEINVIRITDWSNNVYNYRVRDSCVKDLESISRALVKHFKSLESLIIGFKPYRHQYGYDYPNLNLPSIAQVSKPIEGDLASVAKGVRVVLKHPNLKFVWVQERPGMGIDEFLEKFFGDEPKVTKEVVKTPGN